MAEVRLFEATPVATSAGAIPVKIYEATAVAVPGGTAGIRIYEATPVATVATLVAPGAYYWDGEQLHPAPFYLHTGGGDLVPLDVP